MVNIGAEVIIAFFYVLTFTALILKPYVLSDSVQQRVYWLVNRTIPVRSKTRERCGQVSGLQAPTGTDCLTDEITEACMWTGRGPLQGLGAPPSRRSLAGVAV